MSTRHDDEGMSKYAVDEGGDQGALEKAASDGCPGCGAAVQKHGNVVACPNCGTAPFEKKKR
jgi:uncharacterized Zn finger protein (UPF0148 family)